MPQKTLAERVRRAKRRGVPPTWKEIDRGLEPHDVGPHGMKKSGHIDVQAQVLDRTVGRKTMPGFGTSRPRAGKQRLLARAVIGRHPVSVRGRKKPPSQLDIKR